MAFLRRRSSAETEKQSLAECPERLNVAVTCGRAQGLDRDQVHITPSPNG